MAKIEIDLTPFFRAIKCSTRNDKGVFRIIENEYITNRYEKLVPGLDLEKDR
jgi:hypothetical protein